MHSKVPGSDGTWYWTQQSDRPDLELDDWLAKRFSGGTHCSAAAVHRVRSKDGTHEPTKASAKASALGDDDTLGVGLPSSWSLSTFQQRVRGLLDSYLGSREMEDAVDCFREFAKETSGFVDEVVVCALRTALERPAQEREHISSLMHRLHAERVLGPPAMCRGFAQLACAWEELALDGGPRAPCTLVAMLLSCVDAGCIGEGFLRLLPKGLLESAAAMFASDSKTSEPGSDGDGKEGKPRCEAQLRSVIAKLQASKSAIEDARLLEFLRRTQPENARKETTRVFKDRTRDWLCDACGERNQRLRSSCHVCCQPRKPRQDRKDAKITPLPPKLISVAGRPGDSPRTAAWRAAVIASRTQPGTRQRSSSPGLNNRLEERTGLKVEAFATTK